MRQVPNKQIRLFFAIIFLDEISISIIFPTLAIIFFDPHSSLFHLHACYATRSFWYGATLAVAQIGGLITSPILSIFSDMHGRKKILLINTFGALIYALFCCAGILAGVLALIIIGKFIGSLCASKDPVAQAMIGDLSPPEKKVKYMAYLQLFISLGAFIGPVLGGVLASAYFFNYFNFSLPYWIAGLIALITILLTLFKLKDSYVPSFKTRFSIKEVFGLLKNNEVRNTSIILLLMQITWSAYYQFSPILIKNKFYFSSAHLGLFVGMIAFWLAIACTIGIKIFYAYFNHAQVIFYSTLFMIIGFIFAILACIMPANLLTQCLIWISGALIPIGDVIGYCAITSLYSNLVAQDEQGKIMGLCFIIVSLTWTATALLGGALSSVNITWVFVLAPISLLLITLFNKNNGY